jgi:PAS domain S-box-containing protein
MVKYSSKARLIKEQYFISTFQKQIKVPKILVVEDSKNIREEICQILQFEKFEVIWAENGLQGLELAKKELPNLILSDILMPKLTGYQLLAELQKLPTTKSIPFIFLSAKSELLDLRKGMNMGADDYLVKPFNTEELITVVKNKLKKQRLIKEDTDKLVEEKEYSLKEAGRMAKIGSWGYDKQTDTNFWSDAVHQIYGTDPKEGVPELDVILCCFNEDSRNKLLEATRILATNGVPFDIELQMTNLKNEERWIRNIGEPIYNNKNKIIGRRGVSQDITEQQLTRNKIEKTEEMYRLLADNSNDLIFLQEPDSTFQYVSPSIINILGYEQSDILDKKVFDFLNKDDVEPLKKAMKKGLFRVKLMDAYTLRVRHKEGHFVWLEFLTSPTYKDKKNTYFITSARDVTRMMLAKQEIQEYQTSLQRLTTEITLIEEKQKKEIASNIHDHLSQSLVVSKMKINELKKNPSLKVIENDLRFIETHISEALENTRKITYELSPPVLYQLGIIDALSWLLDDVEATHKVPCRLNSNVDNLKLSDVKSILLYRSIQEVINNAIKYGNASLITLKLDKNKLGLDILLTDNGVGFDTSLLKNHQNHSGSGFGLFTVQERIRNIQGRFTIASEINKGTVIKFFIPLSV